MPITIYGDGTVTGITAGGLPDGCIQSADIAAGVIPDGGKVRQYKQYQAVGSYSTTSTSWTSISSDF